MTGFVRNLPDGLVELAVEGSKEEIDAFLTALRNRLASYIADEQVATSEATGTFCDFRVLR